MLTRRGFISGLALALATPAIVRADNLMRVRGIIVPRPVYTFSAWLKASDAPVSVDVTVDGVVAKSFHLTFEKWTKIKVEAPGPMPPVFNINAFGANVYGAQLERAC